MLLLFLVAMTSLSSFAADRIGVGYNIERGIELESPIEVVSLFQGSNRGDLSLNISYNDKQETKRILLDADVALGTPILGAELSGYFETVEEDTERYFSCEMVTESFRTIRFEKIRRKPALGNGRVLWRRHKFRDKYGDKILWSIKSGAYLKITVVAKYIRKLDQQDTDLQLKFRALFTKIKIGEISANLSDKNEDFIFSIFIEQKGGLETELAEFTQTNFQESWGDLRDFQSCLSNVLSLSVSSRSKPRLLG